MKFALPGSQGVRIYPVFLTAPSSSREKVPASRAAVACPKVTNLALVVDVPWVQQAMRVVGLSGRKQHDFMRRKKWSPKRRPMAQQLGQVY